MSTVDADIERIENTLDGIIDNAADKVIDGKKKKMMRNLKALQERFFSTLVQKAIDVKSAPDLGIHSPVWKPLDPTYAARKAKKRSAGGFYKFSGGLRQSLLRSKATTSFGSPLIYEDTIGRSKTGKSYEVSKGRARYDSGRAVPANKVQIKRVLSIDLFPKVEETIRDYEIDETKYFSEKIAYKMTNFRGGRDRPVLAQFMNWWLDVKAKQVVLRALNG